MLTKILTGVIHSMPTKGLENNFILNTKGKVIKSVGRDMSIWNKDLAFAPLDSFFCFNPFIELVTHDDSPSFIYLRKMINTELNTVMLKLMPAILKAAIDLKAPNGRQKTLLSDPAFATVDDKVITFLRRLTDEIKVASPTRSIIDVKSYNTNPETREADGMKYAVLKSPLLNALAFWSTGETIWDTKGATKFTIPLMRAVVKILMPNGFKDGSYYVGNKHSLIPRNKALHDMYLDCLDHLNDIIAILKIKDVEVPTVSPDWTTGLSNIGVALQGVPRDYFGSIGQVKDGNQSQVVQPLVSVAPESGFGAINPSAPNLGVPGGMYGANAQVGGYQQAGIATPPGFMLVPVTGMFAQQPQTGGMYNTGGYNSMYPSPNAKDVIDSNAKPLY